MGVTLERDSMIGVVKLSMLAGNLVPDLRAIQKSVSGKGYEGSIET
jgi:hypothetical protein